MPCRSQPVGQAPEFKGVLVHRYTRPMIAEGVTFCVKCGGWTTKKAKKTCVAMQASYGLRQTSP